jgi:hypothetical protein
MPANLQYKIALGYAVLGGAAWMTIALRQWVFRRRYIDAAGRFFAEGDGELGRRAMEVAGARLSEVLIALLLMAVFAVAAIALLRRSWNAWDWTTAITGLATVFSLILLCASGRVIYAAPFTLAPLWILLYRPGVKAACGVPVESAERSDGDTTETSFVLDVGEEQAKLVGLRQSLRVFEVERGIPTDTFVARYSQGLEEDSADNEEWFALARMARRVEERLASLNGHQSG